MRETEVELTKRIRAYDSACRHNNCYNWAVDCLTHDFKQPGSRAGVECSERQYYNLRRFEHAAKSDELVFDIPESDIIPKGYHKVCLAVCPNYGYHWYRQEADGSWSHKTGWMQVEIGVYDPEDDVFNHYPWLRHKTEFGYFMAENQLWPMQVSERLAA